MFFINDTKKTSTGMRAVVRRVTLSATTEDTVVDIVPSLLLMKYFTYATENNKISCKGKDLDECSLFVKYWPKLHEVIYEPRMNKQR